VQKIKAMGGLLLFENLHYGIYCER